MNTARLHWITTSMLVSALSAAPGAAAECSIASGPNRIALLELYTSEGCSSCPPADRWLSSLAASGMVPERVVPLALHVDYWDYIGWKDRYAKPTFTSRQHELAAIGRSSFVYTPQVVLDGRDYRGWGSAARFAADIAAIARQPARADIRLTLERPTADGLEISVAARASGKEVPALYVALYENGLSTQVQAGENGGATLHHDYVVREWRGPFPVGDADASLVKQKITLRPDWKADGLGVAAFVQSRSGAVLQAVALGLCG